MNMIQNITFFTVIKSWTFWCIEHLSVIIYRSCTLFKMVGFFWPTL